MSKTVVECLKGPVDNSFALLNKFIETCPDDVWAEKSGGWPVWQQVLHALSALSFFTGLTASGEPVAPPEVEGLEKVSDLTVSKEKIKQALKAAQELSDQFINNLNDEDLSKQNMALASYMEMSMAATIAMIAAHNLYHLGSCDAALRNKGLKGVF